ncbi:saccharopine dehydrogenase family protein [Christiangramia salexigens]|uniref:Saccharopine dehydrogenase n=1 Tax=Christiangramia salexigens TaxID=1913577 RepID=A0A1L3J5E8_9FLAO|nr:saccharopine dehydrogenase NADP-binding domain-containing protein [Christiangramia salexigens]APG60333.1 saccharopine dehydrogenase [Christiangramia salexigens]
MTRQYDIIIAGAGGIAEAAGLMLMEFSNILPRLYIGNRTLSRADKMAKWIMEGTSKIPEIETFQLDFDGIRDEAQKIFKKADILLDCLPGSLAPKMAQIARKYGLHYANLTEYVAETDEIIGIAKDAETGFILQTGLAPGYIDVLGNYLFQKFCEKYRVKIADKLQLKVGALTRHAVAPHFYGFTWSPVGVATEYLKEAIAIRDFKECNLPALSERAKIIINGITYEEDLTSGGAADLPKSLENKVESLDYKTLRFPGHYAWVDSQISSIKDNSEIIKILQAKMEEVIPHIEEDQIVLYASVEGKDTEGILRKLEASKVILPQKVGKHTLRAIQTTTAAPLLQSALYLLETSPRAVILQSEIPALDFLKGHFITPVYGKII